MSDLTALENLKMEIVSANSGWQDSRILALTERGLTAVSPETTDPALRQLRLSFLRYRGDALRRLGDITAAWELFQQYLSEAEKGTSGHHTVAALERIALVQKRRGQFTAVDNTLQQAWQLAVQLEDHLGQAGILREQGSTYVFRGRSQEALSYFQQALSIYRQQQKTELQMLTLTDMGLAHHDIGRLDKAAEHYEQGLQLARHLQHPQTGFLLNNLGECYQDLFAMALALTHHKEALQIVEALPADTGNIQTLIVDLHRNLGVDYYYLDDTISGRSHLQAALDLLSDEGEAELRPQIMATLAAVELAAGNLEQAGTYAEQLREFAEENQFDYFRAIAYFLVGQCYQAQGEPDAARQLWQQAQFLAHETGQRMLLWRVHAALGDTYDNPTLAQVHYQIAAELVQQIIAPVADETLRQRFFMAAPIRNVLAKAG